MDMKKRLKTVKEAIKRWFEIQKAKIHAEFKPNSKRPTAV